MSEEVDKILALMQTTLPKTASFLTSTTADGTPSTRQVSALTADDFSVETFSGLKALKVGHIRRKPEVNHLWVELEEGRPARTVMLQGVAEIITDPARIKDFVERRKARFGTPEPPSTDGQCVIKVTPKMLRAEKFVGEGGANPVVIRDFANPVAAPVIRD